jgi:oligo-1,6-glucosidase/alpha-glucosidase
MMTGQGWWKETTIYQIYPRSFKDSNGDGIGDLQGIISKLNYIQELGFETIWISPFFCSPQQDWGYDISDYRQVDPDYGGDDDVQALIDEIHARGMRVLFDLVMNHTSEEHPWFQESRSSRDNPKRDWYIWRDGRGDRPPNNWKSMTGGSAWHYDETTGQWYYATFLPFQPDLNLRNPETKQAMLDIFRYWLDRGIDGYRLDIFHAMYQDEHFRDNPFSIHYLPHKDEAAFFQSWEHSLNQPETIELAEELRTIADSYSPPKVLIGEVFGPDDELPKYLGENGDGLNSIFFWDLIELEVGTDFFRQVIRRHERQFPPPSQGVWVYGNHDSKRVMSKIDGDERIAKLLALFQYTIRGTPVTYYGEEIGMEEVDIPLKEAKDPVAHRYEWAPSFLLDWLDIYVNRDGCRTPMQWSDEPNAGFGPPDAEPWLPIHENYPRVNVQEQRSDDDALLHTYKQLLSLRRDHDALRRGEITIIAGEGIDRDLLVYQRSSSGETLVVVINFGKKSVPFENPTGCEKVLFSIGLEGMNRLDDPCTLPGRVGVVLGD